ncbi:MBL fold metallo-hydrolase [Pseudomonas knackmussii]|uniref:MBL fold metallo-hydrolase n=1 Tax=Pseudomonas knackmussii TaxID=65741 RepID=UPI0013645F0E|nr:MBL fold metallo-hydrolase [Pseudomonas knackmussii]
MKPERIPLEYPSGPAPQPGEVREIVPGVLWLRMPLPLSLDHINLWAVEDGDGWALFDTGMHTEATLDAWRTLFAPSGPLGGRRPTRVFVTHMHPDHVGLAGWLTREFGCELWMTFGEYMNCRVLVADNGREAPPEGIRFYRRAGWDDAAIAQYRARFGGFGKHIWPLPESYRRLHDGERIRIGQYEWRVVVGSGHSPEHASFHCPELQLLIAGDQVLPRISPNVSVFPTEPAADPLGQWLESLLKIRREVPDDVLVLPAHNEPFRPLHARLEHLQRGHGRALERLQGLLEEGPKRAIDLFGALFARRIDQDLLPLATGECLANLNYLLQRGLIEARDDADGVAWYSRA